MADMQDSWKDVAAKAEALGLKLKLHLEQESSEDADTVEPGDTKATVEEISDKITDAFESVAAAAKDPAVRSDMRDMGSLFKDALAETFSTASSEVGDAMRRRKED